MSFWALWLSAVLLIASGLAADVPFVFDGNPVDLASFTSVQLEQASSVSPDLAGVPAVTTPSDSEVLQFPVTSGSTTENTTAKNAVELKKALDAREEPDNFRVRDEAVVLALIHPGEKTIEQIMEYGIQPRW